MKILYVTTSYYPHLGGVEYVVKSVAERLARMGHDIVVLAGEPNMDKPAEDEINEVHIVRWPVWSPGGAYHIPRRCSEHRRQYEGLGILSLILGNSRDIPNLVSPLVLLVVPALPITSATLDDMVAMKA